MRAAAAAFLIFCKNKYKCRRFIYKFIVKGIDFKNKRDKIVIVGKKVELGKILETKIYWGEKDEG